jgi:mRNA-degrading endonuclease toxin of MazEF toxin-antitoxin module
VEGKATASQLTTVAHQRLKRKLGQLTQAEMIAIDEAIRWQLDL